MKTFLYFKSMRAAFQGSPFSVEWPNRNPSSLTFSVLIFQMRAPVFILGLSLLNVLIGIQGF